MENTIIRFICPHCGQPLAFKRPETGYGVSITCPKCQNNISVRIREKAIRLPEPPRPIKIPQLVMTEGPQANKQTFTLCRESNIVGRKDDDVVQDIAISGDMTISRRSVEISVSMMTGGGFSFMLKVLNAKNPVYVNNTPLHTGNSIILRPGDILMLGSTKLMLSV